MGHYDDCYEADYAKEREEDRLSRNAAIPKVIAKLQEARHLLGYHDRYIFKNKRMQDDIEYMILALKGQIEL